MPVRTGGEVAACVADVDALEQHLTPELLTQHRTDIQSAPFVLLDGNLSPEAILVRFTVAQDSAMYSHISLIKTRHVIVHYSREHC